MFSHTRSQVNKQSYRNMRTFRKCQLDRMIKSTHVAFDVHLFACRCQFCHEVVLNDASEQLATVEEDHFRSLRDVENTVE